MSNSINPIGTTRYAGRYINSIKKTASTTRESFGVERSSAESEIMTRLSSGPSAGVLDKLSDGHAKITQEEWNGLLAELRDMGVISASEYDIGTGQVLICGYTDKDGNDVVYDCPPELSEKLRQPWTGYPLEYLSDLQFNLDKWSGYLSLERDEWGHPKFDTSPIDKMALVCGRVIGIVKDLLKD